jgi:CD109 antigen
LSDQPVLGDWTIVVNVLNQKFEKTFTVAEYILPTYDVEVILPSYATYNESDVVCTVKATYTYGKPVKGDVTLTVQPRVRYNMLTVRPLEQFQAKATIDGSVDIPVRVVRDLNLKTDFFEREIEFFALVEEGLTGRKYNKTGILKMFDKKVKIELVKTSKTFKPGLKYTIILKVSYQDDIPVEDNGPPVRVRYGYTYNDDAWNQSFTGVPSKGILTFDVTPPVKEVMVLGLRADYQGHDYYLETIEAAQSPSDSFIQITMPQDSNPRVGQEVSVQVVVTEPLKKIVYEVMGRGDIVLARSFQVEDNAKSHEFTFTVTHKMAPKARIVAYYVRLDNQEIVADALNFDVEGVFRTPVSLTTSVSETKPGSPVKVSVNTKPGAYVGILGLDQSILLLKTGNDLTQADVIKELETYDGGKTSDIPTWYQRRKRSLWYPGSVSAGEIFQDSGVIIISNGLLHRNFPQSEYCCCLK